MRTACLLLAAALAGCAAPPSPPPAAASRPQAAAPLETILQKQIYQMTPVEAGRYVAWVHQSEPDLRKRIAAIGRKNIGQPYRLNLLGEFPYEVHDDLPMFSLDHSDCV
ncbi:MAG: N-acetylmuramoyl-L-alanine amidase-like domain-containing protein, partial [Telluria sp.]